jgi:lipoate-protein ligase A
LVVNREQPWQPYPERILETPLGGLEVEVFEPSAWQVVMGAGGKAELEVHFDQLQAAEIPLYKRKGGGGTVLLGPGVIVITVHAGVAHQFRNLAYFDAVNRAVIAILNRWQPLDYRTRGISDIAIGEKKIVGSSIFRRRQYLLYQASLLVETDMELMSRLLKHPPRQPDYRRGRDHRRFVTSLREAGITIPLTEMIQDLKQNLPTELKPRLIRVDR